MDLRMTVVAMSTLGMPLGGELGASSTDLLDAMTTVLTFEDILAECY
jgi:hypothetical protein